MVTHEKDLAGCADRVITIQDGNVLSDIVVDDETKAKNRAAMFEGIATDSVPDEPVPAQAEDASEANNKIN